MVTQQEAEAYLAELEKEAARVVKGIHNVRITGAVGAKHAIINGVYKPTEELCDNATDYVRVDDTNRWLEYNSSIKQWQVKSTAGKFTSSCYAYCTVSAKCPPQDCPEGEWVVSIVADEWVSQPAVAISVVTQQEAEAHLAEVEREAARIVKGSQHVRIFGAFGVIDGVYKPTEEMHGNATVYVKVDDDDMWLEYHAERKQWQVKETVHKGTKRCYASCAVGVKWLPHECPVGEWFIGDEYTKSESIPTITISAPSVQEIEAYLAEATRALKGSHNIIIIGATGPAADYINGMYKPTNELCGNVAVYTKIGNSKVWLEFLSANMTWQIKYTENKGKREGFAYCNVPAKCLPQDIPTGLWRVNIDGKWERQSTIIIKQKKRTR